MDTTPLTGHGLDKTDSLTAVANKKAVEALELLLSKLPHKSLVKDGTKLNIESGGTGHVNDIPFKQFEIPNDPTSNAAIPPFKPLQSVKGITSTYTVRLGPIEAVTKHTIGQSTSGEVKDDKVRYTYDHPTKTFTVSASPQPPLPSLSSPSSQSQSAQLAQSFMANRAPLDLYHTMALKQGNGQPVVLYQPYEVVKSIAYEI